MHPSPGKEQKIVGKCLCGGVAFEAVADSLEVSACHCGQCRAWSGHYWASLNVLFSGLKIKAGEENLSWHRSSDFARRGFCARCGSSLFWHADKLDDHKHRIAIGAGAVSQPAGLRLDRHIFMADKGDYYDVADDAQKLDAY